MTTTDMMGQCVTEAELDDPSTWQNKGAILPRTCFDTLPLSITPDILAEALGHDPSEDELIAAKLSWCRAGGRDMGGHCGLKEPDPLPLPNVPIGASGLMLAGALALAFVAVRHWRES